MSTNTCVGCIANPMAGKDIRRLVAYSSRIDNQEKVNIVRRILLGLESAGVATALMMPDTFQIAHKALEGIHHRLRLRVRILEMEVSGQAQDSRLATELMRASGVQCLLVLGGDGTHRMVAQASGSIPLVPISTGTNNVFPQMLEGTTAGLAAGLFAGHASCLQEAVLATKRLEVWHQGVLRDIALVDVAVSQQQFLGARALWDVADIQELFVTQGSPSNIGLSSIAGWCHPIAACEPEGLHLMLGDGDRRVWAPIAPGLIVPVGIRRQRVMQSGEGVAIDCTPATLALDGERELPIKAGEACEIRLSPHGPKILDVDRALRLAQQLGICGG